MYCSMYHPFTPCLNSFAVHLSPHRTQICWVHKNTWVCQFILSVQPTRGWHGSNPPRRVFWAKRLSFARLINTRLNKVFRVINVTRLPSALNVPRQPTTAHQMHFSATTSSKWKYFTKSFKIAVLFEPWAEFFSDVTTWSKLCPLGALMYTAFEFCLQRRPMAPQLVQQLVSETDRLQV